jgi:hypothetical protein
MRVFSSVYFDLASGILMKCGSGAGHSQRAQEQSPSNSSSLTICEMTSITDDNMLLVAHTNLSHTHLVLQSKYM